ncbi:MULTISPECIES: hypothetical protein [Moorena]|uniref:PRMT5 arginine-N-methyltransferase domain-containing protein n=1 Tax=Moorena producens 3L TaxID=489825 RepID=F4XYW2_9CYAN|nr:MULTISPECIES: hypothetical protein [Moorena]NEQ17216.1 hypothetical protein [Moorena sp. SIO3E2]EGJ30253.1 hypothetical protein LYNGBM3L_53570 [Moorena producens 3L]NEP37183.1 hypothetical protein [Moorena sp. SIO3B2]NEP70316.1 hypothetical protein [Moorena sp. SIO3A5]NER92241.1 hypothetical protein [Moorena sp. SIO3A2]
MTIRSDIFKFFQNLNFVFLSGFDKINSINENNNLYINAMYDLMENDEIRTQAYRKVISEKVKDKVAVEIGTGKALLLPKFCVDAGVKKIYTIEENEKAFAESKKLLEELNLEEKIKIYQGFSQDIEIEEKCDILVHEIVGSIGSREGMVLAVNDAKERFLKPNAEFIPYQCITKIAPVSPLKLSPYQQIVNLFLKLIMKNVIINLSDDFNFSKPRTYLTCNFPVCNLIAEPQEFENIVFAENLTMIDDKTIEFIIEKPSLFDGFIFYINLWVDRETVIDTLSQKTSWLVRYAKLFEKPLKLEAGDFIKVKIERDVSTTQPKYEIHATVGKNGRSVFAKKSYKLC